MSKILYNVSFIPRVGDNIDGFYSPLPTVKNVIVFPTYETLSELGCISSDKIDAIVFC